MNPKFIELIDKAGFALWEDEDWRPRDAFVDWSSNYDKELEKFAELIVRECIDIVNDAERGGSNEIWDNAVKFIKRDLQEHFGVEE